MYKRRDLLNKKLELERDTKSFLDKNADFRYIKM